MHYHLIGIAGTAMGSLAGLLREGGHTVTGSDQGVYPPMSTLLDELGIEYARSFDPGNLEPEPDVVIVGNAVSRGNPELEAVLERRIRYTSSASVVKEEFLRSRRVIAVAGTHGKTTTTSILAWILEAAGLKPSFLIGGVAENFGTSFRLVDESESELFVVEADEYDTAYFDKGPKMWHYLPQVAVVTNIEFDHADIYRDEEAYRFAFSRFINLTPGNGTLVAGWESPIVRELAPGSFAPVESFGLDEAEVPTGRIRRSAVGTGEVRAKAAAEPEGFDATIAHPRWRADGIEYGPRGAIFNVYHDGECLGDVETPLTGAFNVRNCLAAIAAAVAVGAEWDGIVEGLRTFRSVRRRMEIKGEERGVLVIDDFAHHPTAVRETIAAVRQRFGARRVVAVFEPRSYTAQRHEMQDPYRRALSSADEVVLAGRSDPDRYDAETGLNRDVLVRGIQESGTPARYIPDPDEIVRALGSELKEGDVVLFMSNGGFGGVHGKMLDTLRAG